MFAKSDNPQALNNYLIQGVSPKHIATTQNRQVHVCMSTCEGGREGDGELIN